MMMIDPNLIGVVHLVQQGKTAHTERMERLRAEWRRPARPIPRSHLLRVALFFFALAAFCFYLLIRVNAQEQSVPVRETPTPIAFKVTTGALVGLAAVDVAQSVPCLNSPRCSERNPLYKHTHPAGFAAIKAGGITGLSVMSWKLRKTRPKLAWSLLGALTFMQGYAVAHNARELSKRPPDRR